MKGRYSLFSKRLKLLKICPKPSTSPGPWSAKSPPSSPKLRIPPENSQQTHVISIQPGEEEYEISIHSHVIKIIPSELVMINKLLKSSPSRALVITTSILKSPFSSQKLVEKVLSRQEITQSLTLAIPTLSPIFSSWTCNPSLKPCSSTIYVVFHCLCHSTTAIPLRFKGSLNEGLSGFGRALDNFWNEHIDKGFSCLVVTPMGCDEMGNLYP